MVLRKTTKSTENSEGFCIATFQTEPTGGGWHPDRGDSEIEGWDDLEEEGEAEGPFRADEAGAVGDPERSDGSDDDEPLLENEKTPTYLCRADLAHVYGWDVCKHAFLGIWGFR